MKDEKDIKKFKYLFTKYLNKTNSMRELFQFRTTMATEEYREAAEEVLDDFDFDKNVYTPSKRQQQEVVEIVLKRIKNFTQQNDPKTFREMNHNHNDN